MSSSVPDPADLTAFLEAQWSEDEQAARDEEQWRADNPPVPGTSYVFPPLMARGWDEPARVLAEVAAKRAILNRVVHDGGWELRHGVEHDQIETYYWSTCSCGWEQEVDRNSDIEWAHDKHREAVGYNEAVAADVVRALAQSFRGAPGWRNEWAIED